MSAALINFEQSHFDGLPPTMATTCAKEFFAGMDGEAVTLISEGEVLGMVGVRGPSTFEFPFIAGHLTEAGKAHPTLVTRLCRAGLRDLLQQYPKICTAGYYTPKLQRWLKVIGLKFVRKVDAPTHRFFENGKLIFLDMLYYEGEA